MSKTIITIKPIKTELLSSSKKTVVNQSSGQTTVMIHRIKTTVIGKQGHAGKPITWEDLTPEQIALLKGDKGDAFTYEDFTPEQLEALRGQNGLNNYELAVANGFVGSYEEWEITQHGQDGDSFTFEDLTPEQKLELKGDTGKSQYQSYLDTTNDNPKLSEQEWSESFKQKNIFTIQFYSTNTSTLNKWEVGSHTTGYMGVLLTYAGTTTQLLGVAYDSNMGGYICNVFKHSKLKGIIFQAGLIQGTISNLELLIFAKKKQHGSFWANYDNAGIILYNDFITLTTNNTQIYFSTVNVPDIVIPSGYHVQFAIRKTTGFTIMNAAISILVE